MSHVFIKTQYENIDKYGGICQKNIYCHKNNTADIITIKDDQDLYIVFEESSNDIMHAIDRLLGNHNHHSDITHMTAEERKLIFF